jgi:hypothetical protein
MLFGNSFEVVQGLVQGGLMANSNWFRVDLVPVHFTLEIGLQFGWRST